MSVERRFPLLGEPLALDLVNTRVLRDGDEVDLLDTPSALSSWLHAERGRIAWAGAVDAEDLRAVRVLRDVVDRLLRARRGHARPTRADLQALNAAFAAPGNARLAWPASGPLLGPPPHRARRNALRRGLANDAVRLLTGPQSDNVRECANPDCRLQFLARNPRRRWCSSALCGNRIRVARHYARHSQGG
ncbi:MAG: CGNR zinc finger domain-containing protein [Rhodanobacteraceae bacterium]